MQQSVHITAGAAADGVLADLLGKNRVGEDLEREDRCGEPGFEQKGFPKLNDRIDQRSK